jgi:hypothetical protein
MSFALLNAPDARSRAAASAADAAAQAAIVHAARLKVRDHAHRRRDRAG